MVARTGAETGLAKLTRLVDDAGKYAFTDNVGMALLQVEEDRTFRTQLPTVTNVAGQQVTREPDLKLDLHVMFAANFKQYDEGLKYLSLVMTFFQSHSTFGAARYPALDPRIERLNVELESLSYEQLNQVWAFIGGKQTASAVYRVRLVILQDEEPRGVQLPITEVVELVGMR
jgi:hypothetical protein